MGGGAATHATAVGGVKGQYLAHGHLGNAQDVY